MADERLAARELVADCITEAQPASASNSGIQASFAILRSNLGDPAASGSSDYKPLTRRM
jgi:hypothetical protein